jgi:folate-binding protein YgfZ
MNSGWHDFLLQHGATIDKSGTRFGDRTKELIATLHDTVLCALSHFGVLRVSGDDAQLFLQNLLSNDIDEVSSTRAQLSSFNTAKGRMLASMLIWRDGDDYLLQLPQVLCEPIRKKLSMYILRAKVNITDASNDLISLGLSGTNAQKILVEQFGNFPSLPFGVTTTSQGNAIKIDATRLQINTTIQHAPALWEKLSQHAQPVSSNYWDWLNIRSGIPFMLPQTQEQFVAQMVNFDLVGGVNFKKGCYPGQEIVARTQYLGKLKRRMYLAQINAETPQPGDELFSADMEGQASGMIVNAAPAPTGGYDVLATVQIASRETQSVHWKSLHGEILQFLPLPYSPLDA